MPVRMERQGELRRRLDRLEGLPLRVATVRALLKRSRSDPPNAAGPPLDLDPGWVLAVLSGRIPAGGTLGFAARAAWWRPPPPAAAPALRRLWRHAVAAQDAARNLAKHGAAERVDFLGRVALLHRLGWWAVAAVAPALVAELLAIPDPAARRRLERDRLGVNLESLGRDLADRWGAPELLAAAAWLHADGFAVGADPEGLGVIQRACRAAEATRWALDAPGLSRLRAVSEPDGAAPIADPCRQSFTGRRLPPREERLLRAACRLAQEQVDVRARHALLVRRIDDLAAALRQQRPPEPSPRDHQRLDALAEFAAGAAHELNNPLAVILGRAQLLLARRDADPEATRSLKAIIGQAQRAHRILRDLMYVARPGAPRPRRCQPPEILRACLRDLQPEADARGVVLEGTFADEPAWAWADPDPLRQVVEALVRNALEATPRAAAVAVAVRREGMNLIVQVRDQGPGLTDREARHLLDPFFCGRQAGRGLGLGLPRAARFLDLVGGSLQWWDEPAGGTVFEATIPLQQPPDEPRAGPAPD